MRTYLETMQTLLPLLMTIGVLAVILLVYLAVDMVVHELREADRLPADVFQKVGSHIGEAYAHAQAKRDAKLKAERRNKKEDEAWEGFFQHPYVSGFNADTGELFARGLTFETAQSRAYNKLLDKLADTQIFENTEVL